MTDPRIERILDRQAIADLLTEYCRALDLMDLEAIAKVFTADCRVEYGPEERLTSHGAAGVAKSLERMWRWARTSHHLSNIQIEFEGADEARAISYVIAWHERPDGSTATVLGQYHDRLRRLAEGWRIAERRMLMNGNTRRLHRQSLPHAATPRPRRLGRAQYRSPRGGQGLMAEGLLAGKTALITGGAQGLGRAILDGFAGAGARGLDLRSDAACRSSADGLDLRSRRCDARRAKSRRPAGRPRRASAASTCLVANAGIVPPWRESEAIDLGGMGPGLRGQCPRRHGDASSMRCR